MENKEPTLKINVTGKKIALIGRGPITKERIADILKKNGAIFGKNLKVLISDKTAEGPTDLLIVGKLPAEETRKFQSIRKAESIGIKKIKFQDVFNFDET